MNKLTACHCMPLQLFERRIVVALGAQHVALRHSRLRLADDELVVAERATGTGVATLDKNSLGKRPRVFAGWTIHALGLDADKLHVTAAAATTR